MGCFVAGLLYLFIRYVGVVEEVVVVFFEEDGVELPPSPAPCVACHCCEPSFVGSLDEFVV